MNFDPLLVGPWIRHQVRNTGTGTESELEQIESHCLALATNGLPECYRFPERAQLFWRGLTGGGVQFTSELEGPDLERDAIKAAVLQFQENDYHPLLRKFLIENELLIPGNLFPISPQEVAFKLAGGSVP